ncbi:MAG: glycosyltransferase [Polaromonas sp.]|nr:glycosyltransferase [Polaromonas sp.]
MAILISYHHFPHYRAGVFKELIKNYPRITFIASEGDSFSGIPSMATVEYFRYIGGRGFWFKGLYFQPRLVIESIIGSYDVYVFLANPNFISTWVAALIARLRGKRVIFWGHGFKSAANSPKNNLRKIFFKLANVFYAYGWRAKKNAEEMGFDVNLIYVGFNSLDYDLQLGLRNKCLVSLSCVNEIESCLKLLCISRLTKICRYDVLFEAIALARTKYSMKVQIKVIGDGPEIASLKSQASMLGIDVDFIGALYDEEQIATHLYEADVTVSPGKVGLTAMHSMMYGTPVISHDDFESQMPEVEAIVPGYTGYLFEKDNVADLAEKLRDFKVAFPDRELTRQRCFAMIDKVYNPAKQVVILTMAIQGSPAPVGNDAFVLFDEEAKA